MLDAFRAAATTGSYGLREDPRQRALEARLAALHCLPIADAYRTLCVAPSPEVRAVFEAIGGLRVAA